MQKGMKKHKQRNTAEKRTHIAETMKRDIHNSRGEFVFSKGLVEMQRWKEKDSQRKTFRYIQRERERDP